MKNNKIFVFLMSFVFALILPLVFTSSNFVANAQEEDFILIETYQNLKEHLLQPSSPEAFASNYKLGANIEFPKDEEGAYLPTDFLPIGLEVDESGDQVNETITNFTGVFDGNGYSIIGLSFDTSKTYYTYGFFANLQNATVKNLTLDKINLKNENAFNLNTLNNVTIKAGGLSAISQGGVIENVTVRFATDQPLNISGNRVDFGGLVARTSGTTIRNVKVEADFSLNIKTESLQTLNAGLVVGELVHSYLHNIIAKGSIKVEKDASSQSQQTVLNLGAIAATVESSSTFIKATYSNIVFETVNLQTDKIFKGALVGAVKEIEAPSKSNLSHNVLIAKEKTADVLTDYNKAFGKVSSYNMQGSVYNYLTRDSYSVFEESSYWLNLEDIYKWNTKTVWKLSASGLPALQVFDNYEVATNISKTRIALSSSTLPQDLLDMYFVEDEKNLEPLGNETTFRYNEKATVLISLKNPFDIYYKLKSVEINSVTVIETFGTNANYSLVALETETEVEEEESTSSEEEIASTKSYLFSFNVNNYNSGEISITLDKIAFSFTVQTQNADEGKVRRESAQTSSSSVTQTLMVGNQYGFVADPEDNFAIESWVMEFVDEITLEPYFVELEKYGNLISFEFGNQDDSGVTENFLKGGKLVAVFSSNITKITFKIEEGDKGENKNAGQIFNQEETEEYSSSQEITFVKGRELVFVAKEKDGYTFVGWFDNENRSRGTNQVLNYETNNEEDFITLIAVYERDAGASSLRTLWIVLSAVGAVAVIAVVIIIIRRKRSDLSYRNFY